MRYDEQDMIEDTNINTKGGGGGRVLLWLSILIGFGLLSFVTATAIQNNPFVASSGISKWKFIEKCKEATHHPEKLIVANGKTLKEVTAKQMKKGDQLYVHLLATPQETVKGARAVDPGKWAWTSPMEVGVVRGGAKETFGSGNAMCIYEHKEKKLSMILR